MASPRRSGPHSRGYSSRKTDLRPTIERFLIVCEGEQTEPKYFTKFRVPKDVVVDVRGLGANTESLVREAVRLRDGSKNPYNQVWCVFDRDSFPARTFNAALALAANEKIRVAYSNEAFELWYLLHFHYYESAISRADYIVKLSELRGSKYEKNSEGIFDELLAHQQRAIANAERLLLSYPQRRPERDNPSTTVHLLVSELRRFERDFQAPEPAGPGARPLTRP